MPYGLPWHWSERLLHRRTLALGWFRSIRFGNNTDFVQELYSVLRGSSCFEKFLLVGNPITRLDTAWKQNRSVLYGQVMMFIEERLYRIVVRIPAVFRLPVFDADFYKKSQRIYKNQAFLAVCSIARYVFFKHY